MKQVVCPICGSKDLVQKTKSESITVPFSEPVEVTENMFLCNVCGESGDFTGENDQLIDAAGLFAVKKSALNILGYLTEHGVTMAYLERAMDLPIRTASRWKEGHISAPAVALLRCLRTYPWLIDVADNDFNADFAKAELVKNALDSFGQLLDQNNIGINTLSVTTSGLEAEVTIKMAQHDMPLPVVAAGPQNPVVGTFKKAVA